MFKEPFDMMSGSHDTHNSNEYQELSSLLESVVGIKVSVAVFDRLDGEERKEVKMALGQYLVAETTHDTKQMASIHKYVTDILG